MSKITQVEKDRCRELAKEYTTSTYAFLKGKYPEIADRMITHIQGAFVAGFGRRGKLQTDPEFRRIRAEQMAKQASK